MLKESSSSNSSRMHARLIDFPDTFKINVSDARAYKQFGNSVVVPVMEKVAQAMQPFILEEVVKKPRFTRAKV